MKWHLSSFLVPEKLGSIKNSIKKQFDRQLRVRNLEKLRNKLYNQLIYEFEDKLQNPLSKIQT